MNELFNFELAMAQNSLPIKGRGSQPAVTEDSDTDGASQFQFDDSK